MEKAMAEKDFGQALRLASQARRLFPTVETIDAWKDRVLAAREQHKFQLERDFLEAADRDPDQAMELLKELDLYLTPEEGQQYEEVARGVIGAARENLGVRFKMAVQDKNWATATKVGEQIIEEFPNTRMADEVRQHLDVIRAKSQGLQNPNALF